MNRLIGVCLAVVLVVLGALAMATPPWPDPVANQVLPMQASPITHGPILGAPQSDSVRVWVRSEPATEFEVLVAPKRSFVDLPFADASVFAGRTDAERDGTGYVTVSGLQPNSHYAYAIRVGGEIIDPRGSFDDPWPSFRTLPDASTYRDQFNPEGLFNFAFSIGACQRQRSPGKTYGIYPNPPAFDNLFKRHRDEISFHVINGDYTYEESIDGTIAGVENNYKLYLDRGRSLNRFLHHVPMMTIYNDHEATGDIDGSGEVGLGDGGHLLRDPAISVWQYYAQWANGELPQTDRIRLGNAELTAGSDVLVDEAANFANLDLDRVSTLHVGPYLVGGGKSPASQRGGSNVGVYQIKEVVDARRLRLDRPAKSSTTGPYSIGTHHYFERKIANTHMFVLDTRGERSAFLSAAQAGDADRFVLGEAQERWLVQGVQNSDADFLFIVSPDPWFIEHSAFHTKGLDVETKGDGYTGYVAERRRLMQVFDALDKPVLLLTGDVHHPVAARITDNVWEFLISPVNSAGHPLGTAGLPPLGGYFDSQGDTIQVRWIGGYPDNVHYLRQRHTVYGIIQVNNLVDAARPTGSGYQHIAYDNPQVLVRFHDGYSGRLLYCESISTLDARPPGPPAAKVNRFGHWKDFEEKK